MSRTHLSAHCLFTPVEPGGVLPCFLRYRPHSSLAPPILRLGLWGQLQAGEGVGGTVELWELTHHLPIPPRTTLCPWDGRVPEPLWVGGQGTGASGKG